MKKADANHTTPNGAAPKKVAAQKSAAAKVAAQKSADRVGVLDINQLRKAQDELQAATAQVSAAEAALGFVLRDIGERNGLLPGDRINLDGTIIRQALGARAHQ